MCRCLFDMVMLVHGYERDKVSICFTKCTDIFIYSYIKFHITRFPRYCIYKIQEKLWF
jgi:hypothetical protein